MQCLKREIDHVVLSCRFLEQQCLLSELRDMVNCLQADNNQQKDQECQSQLSHSAQTPCSAVLESLSKHLQAALLTQHLRLPAVEAQQQNPLSTVHGELPDSSAGMAEAHRCMVLDC